MGGEAPKTPRTAEERPTANPGTHIRAAKDGQGYLPTPSAQTAEDYGHGHSPRIPWPADKSVDHKPFKTKE